MAVAIGKQFGSKLFLFHSVPPLVYGGGLEPVVPEVIVANLDYARAKMNHELNTSPELGLLEHEEVVTEGSLSIEIDRLVEKHRIDLIIVGSHGARGLEKIAVGSTAEMILRRSGCPVLVVGPHSKRSLVRRSVLFACDLNVGSLRAAQYAASLAEEWQSQLTMLHVVSGHDTPGMDDVAASQQAIEELRWLLPADAENWCKVKVRVEFGNPAEEILRVAREEDADIVVAGIHDHRPLADHQTWRTLGRIIRDAPCGVLTVRGHLHNCDHKPVPVRSEVA